MVPQANTNAYHARLLEAILFIAERPVTYEEIMQKLHLKDEKEREKLLTVLKQNLEKRKSFVEILEVEKEQAILMQINPSVKKELDVFRTKKTMSPELLQTLAYIALKQPIKYTDLKEKRGSKAKKHVEELEREGFIDLTPSGRTKVIRTTLFFASVFNLDPDTVREKFKEEVKKRMLDILQK